MLTVQSPLNAHNAIRLALRFLKREWRAGELGVVVAALVVAVGSITAVGFFTDRMSRAMEIGATELLAADMLVLSTDPIGSEFADEARSRGLSSARTVSFRSVVTAGERLELAEVKFVDGNYPLRGRLRTAARPYNVDAPADAVPEPGSAWLDPRLFGLLGVEPGDEIGVGARRLRISAVLSYEPDRGGDLFNIAPRVLLNLDDLESTELVQPGSRVRYRMLFAGDPRPVEAFRKWLSGRLEPNQQIQGIRDARPELRVALERANRFLGLAALVSVLLAGVAIAISARRFADRHLDTAAMLRCLGFHQRGISFIYATEVMVVGAAASLAGCIVGLIAQSVLSGLFSTFLVSRLPAPSWLPVLQGFGTGLVTLAGFALPPLLRLRNVPPARVLRRDLGAVPASTFALYGAAAVTFGGLVAWQANNVKLALYVLGGGVATMIALSLVALLLVRLLSVLRQRVGVAWRFGVANIARRAGASTIQIVGFGVGIMVMLLLTLVRNDLLSAWDESVPPDAPNFFLVNVQSDEVRGLESFLAANGLESTRFFPMIRGRLTAINGSPVSPDDYDEPRAQRLVAREFNLSWAEDLQSDNRITAGRWWDENEHGSPLWSVEEGIAGRLGFKLGDKLRFHVAGTDVEGEIASLRSVEWDSFRVNFFVVAPPGFLGGLPSTYITSFHLPREKSALLAELVRRYPSVTVIDTDALLRKIREIMNHAISGVEYVFAFTLIAGVVVLFAAIQSTVDERRYESAVIRTLGGSRGRVLGGLLAEFLTLGLLAGLVAAIAASAVGAVLATRVFELGYQFNPWLWVIGGAGGAAGIGLAGWLGTRGVLDHPPVETLRAG
ncbi:MAG: FtsX-like permease family protein [Gammaproteobacteria bacterium]|nr:FtsX-like permease family protein [Gammaproteobacteria bacterium]